MPFDRGDEVIPRLAERQARGTGQIHASAGAFVLFITNIICINLAGVVTFLAQGVSPRFWWEADKARKATHRALVLWSVILIVLAVVIFLWQTEF